jgi:hypothetical protein
VAKKQTSHTKATSSYVPWVVLLGAVLVTVMVTTVASLAYLATRNAGAKHNSGQSAKQLADRSSAATSASSWRRVDSMGAGFSVKLPDGWWLDNYPSNVMNGDRIVYSKGDLATITSHPEEPYSGSQKKFNISLNVKAAAVPQWLAQAEHGRSTTSDFTAGSLKGKRYSIQWNENFVVGTYQRDDVTQGTVFYKADRLYQYVFDLPGGKQLNVLYQLPATDKDNLAQVEQVVQSIRVN